MSQATEYVNHLFNENIDGYIQVVKINENRNIEINRFANKNNIAEITEAYKGEKDTYITPNTMYKYSRQVENIRQFRALYIDLDIDKLNKYSKSETMFFINDMVNNNEIPSPSMIVDSGRGLHVYWKIENAPYGALKTWQELEKYLYKKLKLYGADSQALDGARILRLPGTINSKTNTECRILWDYNYTYSMKELRVEYLNYKSCNKNTKIVRHKSNIASIFNYFSLHKARIKDIETICRLRSYNLDGYRHFTLNLYSYLKAVSDKLKTFEEVQDDAQLLNKKFTNPIKESDFNAIMRCSWKAALKYKQYVSEVEKKEKTFTKGRKPGYSYSNEKIISTMDITSMEQKELKTIIGKEEKYRRNNLRRCNNRRNEEGLTPKQAELKALKEEILKLKSEGLSNRKIAKMLGFSESKVRTTIKK